MNAILFTKNTRPLSYASKSITHSKQFFPLGFIRLLMPKFQRQVQNKHGTAMSTNYAGLMFLDGNKPTYSFSLLGGYTYVITQN